MVRAQVMLIDALGIDSLFAVVGGSMGGMQALQWAADYPERVYSVVCLAAAARHSAQNIAFHELGRQAIMADPDWRGGDYADTGLRPEKGLGVARMAAHITYLSEQALQRKFGRELQRDGLSWGFDADFQVESYLRHQGAVFVDRFDANSYLYITRATDYFDMAAGHGARVLDIGCGEGLLLEMLARENGVEGRGLELSPANVSLCLARGLAVVQGDADHDLADFPNQSFDYAVLTQTLQAVRRPREVLSELLRIGERAIVSLPNFAHWKMRWELLTRGRMPMTRALPRAWWETDNIHLCTLRDFTTLCDELDLKIEASMALAEGQAARPIDPQRAIENWRAESALFLLSRK
jgi:methionine biosynthesis protein MetW